ncbi:MAG: ATP-dependent sacrificial sulfur transferase LarE [bacterium]
MRSKKLQRLRAILKKHRGVLIAFSGGVDSTLLLKIAKDVLKDKVIAVTATSPLYPETELKVAKEICKLLSVRHFVIHSRELRDRNFTDNPVNRCYYCKRELFSKLKKIARKKNYTVMEASNYSDLDDFRPGIRAAKKLGIESPLIEVKLTKNEIRKFARKLRLPNWDKPSMACLASRIPYGVKINEIILIRIGRAEGFLKNLGFSQCRVRDHFPVARIEILQKDFSRIFRHKTKIIKFLKEIGYKYIALDLEGYRTGSMNL